MYLSLPFKNHSSLALFKDSIVQDKQGTVSHIFGVVNKIFGNQWVLVPNEIAHARVYNYPLIESFKSQDVKLNEQNELVLKNNTFILITKTKQQTNVTQDDIKRLQQEIEQKDLKLLQSYMINAFTTQELFKASSLSKVSQTQIKDSAIQQVTKEYFNKQLRGKQLYEVPKYLPQTGNWSDTESVPIKIK